MEYQKSEGKLSSQQYWDEVLKSAKLPRINTDSSYLYRVTMRYVDRVLRNSSYRTFFEVGCGSSGWLPYFARKYNFTVSGLDYSVPGCELARQNLKMLGIAYGDIFCKDLFAPDCTEGKRYDVIFSYGVIEHFEKPEEVVKIFSSFLNEGGIIISLVPNYNGLAGSISKRFIRENYDIHNVIDKRGLEKIHAVNGLKIVKNGYAGMFTFGVLPLVLSNHWLFREGTLRRKMAFFFTKAYDKVMTTLFKLLPFDLPTRYFSPYVICIARK
jgi:2-polyprenyl-3-methyl-5-hydroxy-6-metoxy-1,4-benzoquinol methylase